MHTEVLLKNRFFSLVDVTVTIIGVAGKSWTQPIMWVNRVPHAGLYPGLSAEVFSAEHASRSRRPEDREEQAERVDRLGGHRREAATGGARS